MLLVELYLSIPRILFQQDAEHTIVDVMGDLGGLARDVFSEAGEVLEASVKWFESKVSSCIAS